MIKEIKAFITALGVSIVGTVKSETSAKYELENALFLHVTEAGLQFAPISYFAAGDIKKGMNLTLLKVNVIIVHDVNDTAKSAYSQIIDPPTIAVAPASTIAQLDTARNRKK